MASGLYAITFLNALKNDLAVDLDDTTADRFKVMLVTSSYTPDFGTHDFKSDVTNEVTGTGYSSGGESLSSVTLTQSSSTITFDADDVTWASSTITARMTLSFTTFAYERPVVVTSTLVLTSRRRLATLCCRLTPAASLLLI